MRGVWAELVETGKDNSTSFCIETIGGCGLRRRKAQPSDRPCTVSHGKLATLEDRSWETFRMRGSKTVRSYQ